MKKKKYLYCAALTCFVVAQYSTLTCNDFITCSTAQAVNSEAANSEAIDLQAVVEENPVIYVKLSGEVREAAIEEVDVEMREAVIEENVQTGEAVTEQADVEVKEDIIKETNVESVEIEEDAAKETDAAGEEDVTEETDMEVEENIIETDAKAEENIIEETNMAVENLESAYMDYDTPPDNSFKSYMDYRTITDTTSMQYELQTQADTDAYGMRMVDNRYCVAVGSYYSTTVGQAVDIIMENGNVIQCIVADLKQDIHTDSTNRQNPNGSIVEFLVDTDVLHRRIQRTGDISYFDTVWEVNRFSGEVDTVRVYE